MTDRNKERSAVEATVLVALDDAGIDWTQADAEKPFADIQLTRFGVRIKCEAASNDGPSITVSGETAAKALARMIEAREAMLNALYEARAALFNGAPVTVGLENQINSAIDMAED